MNKPSEYVYFGISKDITSFTFDDCFSKAFSLSLREIQKNQFFQFVHSTAHNNLSLTDNPTVSNMVANSSVTALFYSANGYPSTIKVTHYV